MTTYTGASTVTLEGMVSGADPTIGKDGSHVVQLKSPADQNRVQSTNVPIQMVVSHTGSGTATDVNLQISLTADFANPVQDLTLTNRADGYVGSTVTGLIDQTKYFWRARAAYAGSGLWGVWTATMSFTVDTATGRAFHYVHQNVGVATLSDRDAVHSVQENVGLIYAPGSFAAHSVQENIGLALYVDPDAVHWAHWDVNTNTPVPMLWFLKPPTGRAGDGIRIFCFGAGDLQAQYGAVVEIDYGGSRGWQSVPVISWQTYPASVNAYTAARVIDADAEIIDVQHTVVEILIPEDAVPAGYPIRIRTEGP